MRGWICGLFVFGLQIKLWLVDEIVQVHNRPVNVLPVRYPSQSPAHTMYSTDDLPKMVVANLNQGSVIKSMDFHPVEHTLLLG